MAIAKGGDVDTSNIQSFDQLLSHVWQRVSRSRGATTSPSGSGNVENVDVVSTPVYSFGSSDGVWRFLLSTTIEAKAGSEATMANLLKSLNDSEHLLFRAVNQDPKDPKYFSVIEHFLDSVAMKKYQASEKYQNFVREVQVHLEKPMGVHLAKERDGQISSGYYPFGPGGEGGRDDMVF